MKTDYSCSASLSSFCVVKSPPACQAWHFSSSTWFIHSFLHRMKGELLRILPWGGETGSTVTLSPAGYVSVHSKSCLKSASLSFPSCLSTVCLFMSDGCVNSQIILIIRAQVCILCHRVCVCLTGGCQNEKGERAVIMASHVQQKHQREVICCSIFNQWR